MSWKRSRLAAAGVATAYGLVMLAGVNLLADPVGPTFHTKGMRLQNVDNGDGTSSIQALVDVYASDIPKLTTGAIVFNYNSYYWQPSRYTDNTTYTSHVVESTFFRTNPDLYAGTTDPFLFENESVRTEVDVDGSSLVLGFNTKASALLPDLPGDAMEEIQANSGGAVGGSTYTYVNATNEVLLGTLSFRVNPDHLEELTDKGLLENWSTHGDYLTQGRNELLYPGEATSQLVSFTQNKPWNISYIDDSDPTDIKTNYYDGGSGSPQSNFHTKYEVPDVVIRVEAAEKEVKVNAYQAYTDATPADLAATLQRYSSAARLTYPNGDQRDEAMFWGNAVMTIVDKNSGRIFEFQYDTTAPNGRFTFKEVDGTGGIINPDATGDPTAYDPTHGDYTITQPYTYEEGGVFKTYPTPIKVELTVTPVTVIDVTAADLQKSYKIDDINLPDTCAELELPTEARLVFDTVLSGTIPTLPLTTWTNNTTTLPVTNMGLIEGVNAVPAPVFWPATVPVPPADVTAGTNVGTYTFDCADPTRTTIKAAHPWATVTNDYTIEATRIIKPYDAIVRKYEAAATVQDSTGRQIIQIWNQDGVSTMASASTFKVYGPDGVEIDPAWFANTTTLADSPGGTRTAQPSGGNREFRIYTSPGSDTSSGTYPNDAEREATRRHINLGGYFTIVVDEHDGVGESDPIPVYQRRRQNAYRFNYTVPQGGVQTSTDWEEFNFTGHKAGLYPFYLDSNLPSTVVLPLNSGYTVHTRYDGITGAEPGEVRSFAVSSWTKVNADPSGKTSPNWTAGDKVTYGDDLFSAHSYGSAFGQVENPDGRKVQVVVEPEDTMAPVESLRLTYEGTPAPSNILNHSNGEVSTVVFDTRQEGYPYKQEFELTLTNDGTTDIHGIYIDPLLGPTQNPVPDGNQHFEIIKPPATDLAPGASTTFVISYILGLPENLYVDNIYVGTSSGQTKTFIARFRVVDGKLYKLLVQPRPEDGSMGTGGAVLGVTAGVYDPTPAGATLLESEPVWVVVTPTDEYAIKELIPGVPEVYYWEGGVKQYLTPYVPTGTLDDPGTGKQLFQLPTGMPAHDTTIFVDFYEPIPSKLRLTDLKGYANDQVPAAPLDSLNEKLLYDLTDTTYQTTGFTQDHLNYMVVVPFDADISGLELTLYDITVPYEVLGINPPGGTKVDNVTIRPDVKIQLIDAVGTPIVLDEKGDVGSSSHLTLPSAPSVHRTSFSSPDPGKYVTAEITISYQENGTYYERPQKYTVRFIRQAEVPIHTFAYGNTPYGMIMNAGNIPATDKAAAKVAYDVDNRFDPAYTPTKASVAGQELTNYIYWPEAWEGVYTNWPTDWGERNLDRNDYALVVYAGEEFADPGILELLDSTGAKVTGQNLKRSVDVTILDDTGATVADQFNGMTTETISLPDLSINNGVATLTVTDALKKWEQTEGKTIRPGIYALKYSFVDYNGDVLSFTRPLVILKRLGDVNASGGSAETYNDAELVRQRFIQPKGLGDDTSVINYPDSDKTVYRYRICDVNNDRNLNNIDANRIRNEAALTDFYRPTDYIG